MDSLIEQIKHGQIWDFHGGIHPPEHKTQSNQGAILEKILPTELVIPLKQHIGSKGKLCVSQGDQVFAGQALTETDIQQCVPVHAPTSGTVIAIEDRTIAHPSGLSDRCVVIQPDGKDTWRPKPALPAYQTQPPEQLIDHIRSMGIAGMGGAGFPTARKLQSGLARTEVLIINAAECEPYITADDRLMQDCADEIVAGIQIVNHIVKPKLTVIGIEDNKPEAIAALKAAVKAVDEDILIQVVPTKYPSGGEKQLIQIITGKEVPAKAFPASIGVLMQNIGTIYAIKRAVLDGEPLIKRVVTLTGKTLKTQQNRWALLGTPIGELLEHHGYKAEKKQPRVIIGGPMMGFTVPHAQVPVTKTTNCVLVPTRKEIAPAKQEMACIRCSACADVCPAHLLPQQLQWYAKDQDYDKCQDYDLFDCIECGACAYVCPSEIPLVQYYRQAKAEIREIEAEKEAAERARQRFEAKKARMEREKQEREEKHRKAAERRKKAAQQNTGSDDALNAAVERVKAKKAAQSASSDVKPAVAAAIARAKAKQAEAAQAGSDEPDNSEMVKLREERKRQARERKAAKEAQKASEATDSQATPNTDSQDGKKDAVAAAVARAKARKAAQQGDTKAQSATAADTSSDAANTAPAADEANDKKDAVAAAVARAKARKAAQQGDTKPQPETAADTPSDAADTTPAADEANDKKAAVAAAVARAKARKAAQQGDAKPQPETAADTPSDVADTTPAADEANDKKAAVAAAVARAKARKAAQQGDTKPQPETAADTPSDAADTAPAADEANEKKAAVAAAVARAKARKAAQQGDTKPQPATTADTPSDAADTTPAADEANDKKAAVAAAVARAKARKAAQQSQEDKE
ncbi:electron transport complex subunit RsxC [Salinivibrio kushneri]|uniref:electron transport complex subunit RsxC n=2 Tax=Salinivibrio kushneri TaxID=1908198 RepID=UPI000987531F|nr:electron transport complex subunit RsxC [Salinivibrio kushneri]OOE54117.1 electron transport complex subunit RsxC [Salinivibrio kushneri]OOE62271.1 electron transport complex subunit RsxC [Salinivibrio kushneri]